MKNLITSQIILTSLLGMTIASLAPNVVQADTLVVASLPSSHPTEESDLVARRDGFTETIKSIRPGVTTRAEVEKMLVERDGGPQGISSTRYYASPVGMRVEVFYDQTGGTWTGNNRVTGPVVISVAARSDF